MKKVYELKLDDNLYWEWRVVLSDQENKKLDIINALDNDLEIPVLEGDLIRLYLINKQSEKSKRKEKPLESDILHWANDITLGASSPSNGVIISKRLRKTFKKYKLPPHYLYPLEIVNSETKEVNKDYFLLQILGNKVYLTNYLESTYEYTPRNSKEVIKTTKGEFKNYQEFSKAFERYFFEEKIRIKIYRILETDSDILPSYLNTIYTSDIFLKEKDNLKGVIFNHEESMMMK
ncbi:hypothetical protein [Tenacibaculum sp. 190524A05c]|uniref:hypothetical protein n=1 Tax=Tenacibaculum platacis TaxID=3137852 RepID=UPI0032B20056